MERTTYMKKISALCSLITQVLCFLPPMLPCHPARTHTHSECLQALGGDGQTDRGDSETGGQTDTTRHEGLVNFNILEKSERNFRMSASSETNCWHRHSQAGMQRRLGHAWGVAGRQCVSSSTVRQPKPSQPQLQRCWNETICNLFAKRAKVEAAAKGVARDGAGDAPQLCQAGAAHIPSPSLSRPASPPGRGWQMPASTGFKDNSQV